MRFVLEIFVDFRNRFFLVVAGRLLFDLSIFATGTLVEAFPIDHGVFKFQETNAVEFRVLIFEGVQGFPIEAMLCSIKPETVSKTNLVAIPVLESFSRRGKECIDCRFVYFGVRLVALALDGPKAPAHRFCDKVDAHVLPAELVLGKEIVPQPDFGKRVGENWVGLQVALHQQFELVAFIAFRQTFGTVLVQDASKSGFVGIAEINLGFNFGAFDTRHVAKAKATRRIQPFGLRPQLEFKDMDSVISVKDILVSREDFADDFSGRILRK